MRQHAAPQIVQCFTEDLDDIGTALPGIVFGDDCLIGIEGVEKFNFQAFFLQPADGISGLIDKGANDPGIDRPVGEVHGHLEKDIPGGIDPPAFL